MIMIDSVYSKLISKLFKRLVTVNWVNKNLGSPLILFSKSSYMVFIFEIMNDSLGMQFGSSASSYSPPKLTTTIGSENVTRQILTDVVSGQPRFRSYSISSNIQFLKDTTDFIKSEISKIGSIVGLSIFSSLDYIKILEELVSSCYGSTASDVFMLFGADGTIFENCIVNHSNITAQFSGGVCNNVVGDISIQEIVPYDINAILTYKGTDLNI